MTDARPKTQSARISTRCKRFSGDAPEGWLTLGDYAARLGVSHMAIRNGITSGKIPEEFLATIPNGSGPRMIVIDWDRTVYNYLMSKREAFRPDDFVENPERRYRPIRAEGVDVPAPVALEETSASDDSTVAPAGGDLLDDGMAVYRVTDSTTAKYRIEQLKIQRAQLELKVARNELIPKADVLAMNQQLAADVNGALTRMLPQVAPILAAESSALEVRRILQRAIAEALAALSGGDSGAP